jgi:hypothetical protein
MRLKGLFRCRGQLAREFGAPIREEIVMAQSNPHDPVSLPSCPTRTAERNAIPPSEGVLQNIPDL